MSHKEASSLDVPFVTPSVDDAQYRLITLPNGLCTLLISDKEADKAAAAMDVRVGSLSDPDDIPGLVRHPPYILVSACVITLKKGPVLALSAL